MGIKGRSALHTANKIIEPISPMTTVVIGHMDEKNAADASKEKRHHRDWKSPLERHKEVAMVDDSTCKETGKEER
jgi:hypothetical protein